MTEQNSRFSGATWYVPNQVLVRVYGAGGIGSWLSLFAARAGFSLSICDFDFLEVGNFSGQIFKKDQIGVRKVDALERTITDLCYFIEGQRLNTKIKRFTQNSSIEETGSRYSIVCSCFDNMNARRDLFEKFVDFAKANPHQHHLFIDGRLNLESFQIFCIKDDDDDAIEKYRNEALFEDSAISEDICSLKQTSHIAAMIGAQMFAFITNFIANMKDNIDGRVVPYKYEYFSPLVLHNMIEKVEQPSDDSNTNSTNDTNNTNDVSF